MAIMLVFPWIAGVVSGAFLLVWFWRRRRTVLINSVVWALYTVYEYMMYFRITCTGECNIRIDVLLIYPLLAVTTICALIAAIRQS